MQSIDGLGATGEAAGAPAHGDGVGPRPRGELTDEVTTRLREAILRGDIERGTPIRQATLAAEFGVSRLPVREALRRLESEGLVDIRPNSGARVARLDYVECLEIYAIREQLEPLALRESGEHLTSEQIDVIASHADTLPALTPDIGEWLATDRSLHLASYAAVPGPRLLRMIVEFWNTTQHHRRALVETFTEQDFVAAHAEHTLIVDALRSRRPDAAAEILRLALRRSRDRASANHHLFDG